MSGLVLSLVAAIWLATVILLIAVVVAVRRGGQTRRVRRSSPSLLDPLVTPRSDAVHSEAASLLHRPADISQRDDGSLVDRDRRLEERQQRIEDRAADLRERERVLAAEESRLAAMATERRSLLEQAAGLTADEATAALVKDIVSDAKREASRTVRAIERAARETGEERARGILVTALQRLATDQTSESVVSVVQLPGDEMKGRIIGREGRNIRTFEQTTGVNLVIDDTPESVLVSCFDPVRREVARVTLEQLVADGRIHPSRIEDVYQHSLEEVNRICERAARDALLEAGVADVHPKLVSVLGQLRFRTSYGQNVLRHLVESAHLAGLIADELGIERATCVRAAFLHDVGKALTHEVPGSHAAVGADLARRCGESDTVVNAIAAHHNEVDPLTVEAVLTQVADAISGGRPGARRESLEVYVRRLERLEEIAQTGEGVEKVFAMQAGRDIRVMVQPDVVDDIQAQVLARDIAKQIEHELTYPGQIKVTVIRESRATEIAR